MPTLYSLEGNFVFPFVHVKHFFLLHLASTIQCINYLNEVITFLMN